MYSVLVASYMHAHSKIVFLYWYVYNNYNGTEEHTERMNDTNICMISKSLFSSKSTLNGPVACET